VDLQMLESIGAALVTDAIKKMAEFASRRTGSRTQVVTSQVKDALAKHRLECDAWSAQVGLAQLIGSRHTEDVFTDLALRFDAGSAIPAHLTGGDITVGTLVGVDDNVSLLGQPGAGKSTSLRWILRWLLGAPPDSRRIPLLLRVRRSSEWRSLVDELLDTIGLEVRIPEKSMTRQNKIRDRRQKIKIQVLARFLDDLRATILIDGLDEAPPGRSAALIDELRDIFEIAKAARYVLTCRTAAYTANLPGTLVMHIEPLAPSRVETLATRWLGQPKADLFLRELVAKPYFGTEVRPLTLVNLCHVFDQKGYLPEQPKTVYRTIVNLFVEHWDEYRRVRRASEFSNFNSDTKLEFLQELAFRLATHGRRGAFTIEDLESVYFEIFEAFRLPRVAAGRVVREISSHTGLVVGGPDDFEFYHLTVQEYLAAQYLVHVRPWQRGWPLAAYPNEYAVALALSSAPNALLAQLVSDNVLRPQGETYHIPVREIVDVFVSRFVLERPRWTRDVVLAACYAALFGIASQIDAAHWIEWSRDPAVEASLIDLLTVAEPIGIGVDVRLGLGTLPSTPAYLQLRSFTEDVNRSALKIPIEVYSRLRQSDVARDV
jgi:hypothetical protein